VIPDLTRYLSLVLMDNIEMNLLWTVKSLVQSDQKIVAGNDMCDNAGERN
jgi:hypothetical protein